jgi:hypothetical protein
VKNKLSDLNNHLFAQMERLSDEELKGDALKEELIRSKAVSSIAKDIIGNGQLVLQTQKCIWDRMVDRENIPKMLSETE